MTTTKLAVLLTVFVATVAILFGLVPPLLNAKSTFLVAIGVGVVLATVFAAILITHSVLTNKGPLKIDNKPPTALLILLGLSLFGTGCTWGRVDPGHVGVVVPLTGDNKGKLEIIDPGWYMYSFNTNVYEFPTYNLQHNWTNVEGEGHKDMDERLYFADKDGQRIGVDLGIQYNVPREKVGTLFTTYRLGNLDTLRDTVLKMTVRDALNRVAKDYKAQEIYGEKRAEFFDKALGVVRTNMEPVGLHVDNLYVNGDLDLPKALKDTITAQLNATLVAQQKENEKRAVEAEAAKQVAKAQGEANSAIAEAEGAKKARILRAEGEAQANRLMAESLTGNIFELRKLEIWSDVQKAYAQRWGGGTPATVLPGQTTNPFIYDIRPGGK